MDMKEISSNASPELFFDMLAGDKSIIRKVFGRLCPSSISIMHSDFIYLEKISSSDGRWLC